MQPLLGMRFVRRDVKDIIIFVFTFFSAGFCPSVPRYLDASSPKKKCGYAVRIFPEGNAQPPLWRRFGPSAP